MLLASCASLVCCVQASFTLNVLEHGPVEGFVGFFDTQFKVGFHKGRQDAVLRLASLRELLGLGLAPESWQTCIPCLRQQQRGPMFTISCCLSSC